jgi:hypothetical protein
VFTKYCRHCVSLFFVRTLVVLRNSCVVAKCHGIVPYDMSPNDVRLLDINTVNVSWSVHKGEVSCMEVNLVLLHGAPRYNDVLCIGENCN